MKGNFMAMNLVQKKKKEGNEGIYEYLLCSFSPSSATSLFEGYDFAFCCRSIWSASSLIKFNTSTISVPEITYQDICESLD